MIDKIINWLVPIGLFLLVIGFIIFLIFTYVVILTIGYILVAIASIIIILKLFGIWK